MNYSFITGVDIGHYSIKAVVIKPVKGTLTLSSFRELVIGEDIFSDNHLLNHQEIVNKLKQLRKALPIFSRSVALSVPDNSVISKVLQIDKALSEQEKEYAIIEAFSHQSPLDIEELYFDHCFLTSETPLVTTQPVQLYATKKTVVDNRIAAFQQAGFKPILCDAHAHGLARLLQALDAGRPCYDRILLDIGKTRSLLIRDFAHQPPWCKELPLGTDSIENSYHGNTVNHHDARMLFVADLVEHIQRQWQLLPALLRDGVERICLTGGGANLPLLAEQIGLQLELESQLLNPLTVFDVLSGDVDIRDGYRYAGAAGLALLGLDWKEPMDVS